jgi:hypothetical protein
MLCCALLSESALVSTLSAGLPIAESHEYLLKLIPAVQMKFPPIHDFSSD